MNMNKKIIILFFISMQYYSIVLKWHYFYFKEQWGSLHMYTFSIDKRASTHSNTNTSLVSAAQQWLM